MALNSNFPTIHLRSCITFHRRACISFITLGQYTFYKSTNFISFLKKSSFIKQEPPESAFHQHICVPQMEREEEVEKREEEEEEAHSSSTSLLPRVNFKCIPFKDAILTRPKGIAFKSISSSPFQKRCCKTKLGYSCIFRTLQLCSRRQMPTSCPAHKQLCSAESDIARVRMSPRQIFNSGNCSMN